MNTGYPESVVREVNGQVVLDDPAALALAKAVAKNNCRNLLDLNLDRINHFKNRAVELDCSATDTVIVVINVDDPYGSLVADAIMPNYNWQEIRDRGEMPVARGLAKRGGIEAALSFIDDDAFAKLKAMTELAVVVIDQETAEVFLA